MERFFFGEVFDDIFYDVGVLGGGFLVVPRSRGR